ncbi:hypothetical protein KUCAC02_021434, partial [Chaenocephalus aceratus]
TPSSQSVLSSAPGRDNQREQNHRAERRGGSWIATRSGEIMADLRVVAISDGAACMALEKQERYSWASSAVNNKK